MDEYNNIIFLATWRLYIDNTKNEYKNLNMQTYFRKLAKKSVQYKIKWKIKEVLASKFKL